jgi:hypothetical protein
LEGNYLYAQNICDWATADELPDEFYRIDISDIVNAA